MEMAMTHYMELLASNQPWNLILFMGSCRRETGLGMHPQAPSDLN